MVDAIKAKLPTPDVSMYQQVQEYAQYAAEDLYNKFLSSKTFDKWNKEQRMLNCYY